MESAKQRATQSYAQAGVTPALAWAVSFAHKRGHNAPRRRRRVIQIACFVAMTACLPACDSKPTPPRQAVIILGFDGMDPKLTGQMMDEGRLPNFARLREQGSFKPLQTVTPPQSPVAWASFATGLNPGGHGLFDFIHRDPAPADMPSGVKPYSAMARTVRERPWYSRPFEFVFGESISWGDYEIPLVSQRHELLRHGTPFWAHLTRRGIDAWIYRLPANFPAIGSAGSPLRTLTDMGTPDLSDTMGEFSFYTNDKSFDFGQSISGGKAYSVQVINNMVLPGRSIASGTIDSIVSPTCFVFRGWKRLERRLDNHAGCVAVVTRGANQGECVRPITSVDLKTREITLESPLDFEPSPGTLVKIFTRCKFRGPPNTVIKRKKPTDRPRAQTDFTVYIDPDDPVACIEFDDRKVILSQGQWSGWHPIEFPMAYGWFAQRLLPPAKAMCRFYLKQLRPHFELYVSPFNHDPLNPAIPICYPDSFSEQVAAATGRYYTQGLPEDTKALSHHVLSRDEFLQQADIVEQERERLLDYALDRFETGFLFFYYGGTDLVAHMFWGVRDPEHPGITAEERERYMHTVERYYICADRMLGRTMARHPEALIMVISDHGFESFARGFNVNTWLANEGYVTRAIPDDHGQLLNFDLRRSRAYGLGLNGIYVNLKGREREGIVDPADRQALLDEIKEKLLTVVDPKTGRKIIKTVYQSDQVYSGPYVQDIAPDLQIGYTRGYRASWATVLGSFPEDILEDNFDPWGADHCIATDLVPGIIVSNRPIRMADPGLIDLGPTVLSVFGVTLPPELEGRNIFE